MSVDLTPTLPPFTVDEVAAILNCSRDLIYDAVARGEIRALRLGRRVLVTRAECARLLGIEPNSAPARPA